MHVPQNCTIRSVLRAYGSFHYENTPIQIYTKFHLKKKKMKKKKSDKKSDIFHISAQNIDCGF